MMGAFAAALLLSACATAPRNDVFANPRAYLGQTVRVCGEYQVSNLFESSRERPRRGLSIVGPMPPRGTYGDYVCVVGEIGYVGCESTEICVGWIYDYAISIEGIRVAAPPLREQR